MNTNKYYYSYLMYTLQLLSYKIIVLLLLFFGLLYYQFIFSVILSIIVSNIIYLATQLAEIKPKCSLYVCVCVRVAHATFDIVGRQC